MAEFIVTRGLPGCGKSTRARQWVSENPANRAEVNRDHLRQMMHGGYAGPAGEKQVTTASCNLINTLLNSGVNVVCSDTNLDDQRVADLIHTVITGRDWITIWDMRNVSLDTCLERNARRTGWERVPDDVIISMHERYIASLSSHLKSAACPDQRVTWEITPDAPDVTG